jgi:ribonuclease HII
VVEIVCGIDEAGRGALAGAVFAAAVVLPKGFVLQGLTDSKKMSPKLRRYCFDVITTTAISWSIASVDELEVDRINILQATKLAMQKALNGLSVIPNKVIVDGKDVLDINIACEAVVKGDLLHSEISAASVLAKVARDDFMHKVAQEFPQYGFDRHKGYGTKSHLEALVKFGPCKYHRLTFAPIKNMITQS